MGVVQRLISAITVVALAFSLIGVGFLGCLLPPFTHGFATVYANDPASPFDRTQLVAVADATRDYAFGSHDKEALLEVIAEVNSEYAEAITGKGGKLDKDFPAEEALESVGGTQGIEALEEAFAKASEIYAYSPEVMDHLDDCHAITIWAYPLLAIGIIVAVAGLIAVGLLGGAGRLGEVLLAAGAGVITLFVLAGLWALLDFYGFFSTFHELFFVEGNWEFPYDSLLISALPTEFWGAMGAAWLIISTIASLGAILIGILLRKRGRKAKA